MNNRNTISRLAAAVSLAIAVNGAHAQALNSAAQRMFDDLGAVGNVTAPQAFHGQTLSTYTGGSVFIRTPTKTYNLASVALPSLRAGCGGIDLFGGSFSHISSDEMKNMLKNITSALPSVIFQMMIKSVEPLFGSTIEYFKEIESVINRSNISSCEAATSLAGTVMGKAGFDSTKACERAAGALGALGLDAEAARDRCRSAGDVNATLASAGADPTLKDTLPFTGNLVWAALKKLQHLDQGEKELIMSITGTTIYSRAVDGSPEPRPVPPTIRSLSDVLYGNVETGGAVPAGRVRVKLLRCGGSDCDTVSSTEEVMDSLTERVRTIMHSLSEKIASRSGTIGTAEINFVNRVPAPVYRLLSSSNAINNPAIASSKIEQYAQYVAVEFAYSMLARAARMGMDTAQFTAPLTEHQIAQLNAHRANAVAMLSTAEADRSVAEQRQQSMVQISDDIDRLDRALRASMPQQVADLLGYATGGTF
ncbi:conjugal transfer protein TraH [Thauera butanivorans]|uniref:conjugal transfer protein TraH n=1 Tax=Thauera butanivorans TaxID=86174 RepID=UPI000838FC08|nr:conjugal transfer protein TraH [Thauera butanivorans]